MKTVFIGAGNGCRAVLELFEQGRLETLDLEILAVVDVDPSAPGFQLAEARGWPTLTSVHQAMGLPDLELVIELTGDEELLDDIYFLLPPGVRLMDHVLARVFWDLEEVEQSLRVQLLEKTELESRIQEDRARLQEILDTVPDVVMVLDPQMRIRRVNNRFTELAGITVEEAEGLQCDQVFGDAERILACHDDRCPFRQVLTTRESVTVVRYREDAEGHRHYYQISANPVLDEAGELRFVVETIREITEQVLLRRETEESARRFSQIMDAVHGIVTIQDLDGRYEFVNPRAEVFFGLSADELVGHHPGAVLPTGVAEVIERHHAEALGTRGHIVTEDTMRLPGKERSLISEMFPMTDYRGDVVGVCTVAREVTRERELQQELLQSERLAAVGKLAAGVAHELNNPLTGVLTFAEDLLHEADEGDPLRADFQVIVNEAMRCRRIVRDLLDFSRQKAPQRERTDINPLVRRTVNMVSRQASFHDVEFDLDLAEGMPQLKVDHNLVQQALLNLVINARDAMDSKGRIRIDSSAEGGSVVVSVTDSGCGIPADQLSRIFEPFFTTKGDLGNGLGLPAVVSIADQHGGRVEVSSEPGVGTTFQLVFPVS